MLAWCFMLALLAWAYPAKPVPNLRQAAAADLIFAVTDVDFDAGTATAEQAWPTERSGTWQGKTVRISNLSDVRENWPHASRVLVPVNFDARGWRITPIPPDGESDETDAKQQFAVYADTPFNRERLAPWVAP